MSLNNTELYERCVVEEIGGRLTLMTPTSDAVNIIGRNAGVIVDRLLEQNVEELILTGAMAIWAYLIVFHIVVHRFSRVYYDDGKPNGKVLIAAH